MLDVVTLAMPFFGLILLGYIAGKIQKLPETGLAWLNSFVIYIALPALFFQLLSKTPIEELTNITFVAATTFSTYCVFVLAFCVGILVTKGNVGEAAIQGLAGSYSNIGYMGPGITLGVLGSASVVPTALIFCFDNILLFTLVPLLMAIGGKTELSIAKTILQILKKIIFHPFILATIAGVIAAAIKFEPPQTVNTLLDLLKNAAAPCALFSIGVTVALRPVKRVAGEFPFILLIKLVVHPILIFLILAWMGNFDPIWVKTAMLMACLPPASNVYVLARQYNTYVERSSSILLIGTAVSVVTVTMVIYFVTESSWYGILSGTH